MNYILYAVNSALIVISLLYFLSTSKLGTRLRACFGHFVAAKMYRK